MNAAMRFSLTVFSLTQRNSTSSQHGYTLVELLVAMALSLFLMGGVIQVVVGSRQTFLLQEEIAQIQENARFATNFISEDIQAAGYFGACSGQVPNIANTITGDNGLTQGGGIEGFEGGASVFPAYINAINNTDAMILRHGESSGSFGVAAQNGVSIHLAALHNFTACDVVMASNTSCDQVSIFLLNNANPANVTLVHNTGAVCAPAANCNTSLFGNYNCNNQAGATNTNLSPDTEVVRFVANAYYIGISAMGNGIPALFRARLGAAGIVTDELVQGVADMEILYGIDTGVGPVAGVAPTGGIGVQQDGIANRYLRADQIDLVAALPATASAASNWVGWDRVVSVRISLLMRSILVTQATAVASMGLENTPLAPDRFMYQQVSTTVELRNSGMVN